MSARHWTDEQLREIHDWHQAGRSWRWVAEQTGDDHRLAKGRYSKAARTGRLARVLGGDYAAPSEADVATNERLQWDERADSADLWSRSTRIKTLDALIEAADVDLSRWYVDRHTINKWEVGSRGPDGHLVTEELWQVKAQLRRIAGAELAHAVAADLLADMESHAPTYRPVVYPSLASDKHMAEVSLSDHHFGLYAWEEEAGRDWDSDIAARLATAAVDDLLAKASAYPLELITTVIGSDWFHTDRMVDGKSGSTTKGTLQDTDTRRARVFRIGRMVAVAMIDRMREFAPVQAYMVGGNHDSETIGALGEVLSAWYRTDSAVTIDCSPTTRKYSCYGQTLVGYVHGHEEKPADLPLIMAQERPQEWAATLWREWKTGHVHTKRSKLFTSVEDVSGVWVYTLPTLVAPDAWHTAKGYIHQRAAEAFIYHKDDGLVATAVVSASALERRMAVAA